MPIHISNWAPLMAFLDCDTQWRVTASVAGLIWIGLDYSACAARLGRRWRRQNLRADVRVIEEEALKVLNEASA